VPFNIVRTHWSRRCSVVCVPFSRAPTPLIVKYLFQHLIEFHQVEWFHIVFIPRILMNVRWASHFMLVARVPVLPPNQSTAVPLEVELCLSGERSASTAMSK